MLDIPELLVLVVAPIGLLFYVGTRQSTTRRRAGWFGLVIVWIAVLLPLVLYATQSTGFDLFTASLTLAFVAGAALLAWLVVKQTAWRRRGIWVAVLGAWLLVAGPITWIFAWPYVTFEMATIQCGHQPVIASKFMAAYDYTLPGDSGYGPSFLNNGPYYCSAADAGAAGYHRAPH